MNCFSLSLVIVILNVCQGYRTTCACAEGIAKSRRLTTDNLFKRDPVFINEGADLVYVVLERPEQLRIVRLNLSDRSITPLHGDETRSELEPAFSPNGKHYAFLQSRSPASVAMVIRNFDSKTEFEMPPAAGFSGMRSPSFSPNGKRILYAFPDQGRQHIYSINLEAKDKKQLTDSEGIHNWPSYSPDGKSILFGSTRHGNYEIYTMRPDGSQVKRLTHCPFQDLRPRYSPDGQRVAFTSNRDGNYEIYVVNADGTGLRRVTNHPERDDFPAWHPDGRSLVCVSERAGRYDLYLIREPGK